MRDTFAEWANKLNLTWAQNDNLISSETKSSVNDYMLENPNDFLQLLHSLVLDEQSLAFYMKWNCISNDM